MIAVSSGTARWARWIPFLTKECPLKRLHWRWHKVCGCGLGKRIDGLWHGGMWLFAQRLEVHPCPSCMPAMGILTSTFQLTHDEQVMVVTFRAATHLVDAGRTPRAKA